MGEAGLVTVVICYICHVARRQPWNDTLGVFFLIKRALSWIYLNPNSLRSEFKTIMMYLLNIFLFKSVLERATVTSWTEIRIQTCFSLKLLIYVHRFKISPTHRFKISHHEKQPPNQMQSPPYFPPITVSFLFTNKVCLISLRSEIGSAKFWVLVNLNHNYQHGRKPALSSTQVELPILNLA